MKPRTLIICTSMAVCGLSIAGMLLQARQLDALRVEALRLQQQLKALRDDPGKQPNLSPNVESQSGSPSSELLRLRSQFSQLMRRQSELANVSSENERLRARIAAASTNVGRALPPGYIRRSEARYMGYASPEAALQTVLWAIQNRDYTNLVASYTSEIEREMEIVMKETGNSVGQFFEEAEALMGLIVMERVIIGDDEVELKVERVPDSGDGAESIRFRRLNGEWKIDSH